MQFETSFGRDHIDGTRAGCEVRPVTMIFDSKARAPRQRPVRISMKPSAAATGQKFAFVNTSGPPKADEESSRLVKTHVMQEVLRREGHRKRKTKLSDRCDLAIKLPAPRPPPSDLRVFPIETEPYMLKLVQHCAPSPRPPMAPSERTLIDE